MNWIPFVVLAAALALLLLIEQWIHRHLQGTMLLLTGDADIAVILYALPLLPGIIIHELSHALTALLLNVRVGDISIRPQQVDGRIQLGFVPVEKTDVVRASLIGLAPLLVGSAITLLIGYAVFDIGDVGQAFVAGEWPDVLERVWALRQTNDFFLWAYLLFAITNTMLPSRADRQAWTPVIVFLVSIALLIWLTGLGPAVVEGLSRVINTALQWLAVMCAVTVTVDLPFILVIFGTEKVLERVKGVRVDY